MKRFEEKAFLFLVILFILRLIFSIFSSPFEKIDINKATSSQLLLLPGIGREIAQRIIEYRDIHGGFKCVEEILNVKGIGKKKYERLKDFIKVK